MCLTETHLTEEIGDHELEIQNYETIRVDSTSRATGGVQLYIRQDIKHQVIHRIVEQKNYWFLVTKIMIDKKYCCLLV